MVGVMGKLKSSNVNMSQLIMASAVSAVLAAGATYMHMSLAGLRVDFHKDRVSHLPTPEPAPEPAQEPTKPVLVAALMKQARLPFWLAVHQHFARELLTDVFLNDRTFEDDVQVQIMLVLGRPFSPEEKEGLFMVDIGANVGFMGLLGIAAGFQTYFFEAFPLNAAAIQFSLHLNGFGSKGIVVNQALGTEVGVQYCLVPPPGNPSDCILVPVPMLRSNPAVRSMYGENVTEKVCLGHVPSSTLDKTMREHPGAVGKKCAFMKLDVEGFELNILKGGGEFLNQYSPCAITLECNPGLSKPNGWDVQDATDLLAKYGYRPAHNFSSENPIKVGELYNLLYLPDQPKPHCTPKQ